MPLHIDEIFPVDIKNEEELHSLNSLKADSDIASKYVKDIIKCYSNDPEIDKTTAFWYRT